MSTTHTSIEWTDRTWNPVRGCSRVSEGCRNCYAERQAARFAGLNMGPAEFTARKEGKDLPPFFGFLNVVNDRPVWNGKVELQVDKLTEPIHWKKPQRIFVNSMSDLFHEALPDEAIAEVFRAMSKAPQHTYQILTKRAGRMKQLMPRIVQTFGKFKDLWLGVSIEDNDTACTRLPQLCLTVGGRRFVSYEPSLGYADLREYLSMIDWVIMGGESGPGARPFSLQTARIIRGDCRSWNVPFFLKQLGSRPTYIGMDGPLPWVMTDHKGADPDEWPEDLRDAREFPPGVDA